MILVKNYNTVIAVLRPEDKAKIVFDSYLDVVKFLIRDFDLKNKLVNILNLINFNILHNFSFLYFKIQSIVILIRFIYFFISIRVIFTKIINLYCLYHHL